MLRYVFYQPLYEDYADREVKSMAGPPEERQKQLILQREREREAVRVKPVGRGTLMQKFFRPNTKDNVMPS